MPDPQSNSEADLRAGRFRFVGEERNVGWRPDWSAPGASLLWQYNLHYLEWVWALSPRERVAAAADWAERYPPVAGATGWAPYPTSLRLATFCLLASAGSRETEALWPSLWRQAEHLSRRLEVHLGGNHLLENGIALAFAGSCFEGADATRWLDAGLGVLRAEIPGQVLADGMHEERSPMYQLRLVYALALLVDAGHPSVLDLVSPWLSRMAAALAALCHPDGQIALFNDAAFGVYAEPTSVLSFARAALGDRATEPVLPDRLDDAGYFFGRSDGDAVFCDAGALGP
ncbi:MAG: heparinase II/III family protein, partial [Alphaproteobacteria bacterium]